MGESSCADGRGTPSGMGPYRLFEGATCRGSTLGDGVEVYAGGGVLDSRVGDGSSIGDGSVVARSTLGRWVRINRRNYVNDSAVGDLTYTGQNVNVHYSRIGRCCSIAVNADIGSFDHDYLAVTTLPAGELDRAAEAMGLPRVQPPPGPEGLLEIGNDVWIASGAVILRKAPVGDGAVIGAGAVVTKPVPPYAIAVGVPARVVGFRFDAATVERLLAARWWDWPLEAVLENRLLLTGRLDEEKLAKMEGIARSL